MPVRASTIAALAAALSLAASNPAFAADPPRPQLVPQDSTPATGTQLVQSVRAAYEAAWAHRQAGDPAAAVAGAERALLDVDAGLSGKPNAGLARELTDLRSRISGLRDAAQADLRSASPEPGNEADDKVLNAPAVDAIQLQFNEQVYGWINFFTGAGRSTFERWLKRSGRYMDLFRSVLQKEGMPPDLVHLVFVESGFNVNARSVSAAVGPWQFLRGTAKIFGLTVDQWVDERKDPEKATVAAARYLKHLYGIFGDWPLALASYNAGEGTVLRAIKAQGTTNYWDLRLPRQTEEYVPQFMAALAISRDPRKYGFDEVDLDDPLQFDQISLRGPVNLQAVARLAECSYEELRDLNPAVLRGSAKGRDGVTTLRVPSGKGEVLLKKLEGGAKLPAVNLTLKHKVQRGETLQRIANQYSVSAKKLASVNGVGRKRPLRRGMVLTIPASLNAPAPAVLERDDPRASTAYVPPRNVRTPNLLKGNSSADGRITVTVKKGESLQMIADRYNVSVEDMKRWNRLKSSSVRRGMRLKIRTGSAAVADSLDNVDRGQIASLKAPKAKPSRKGRATVVVRSGDTLGEIAKRHRVSVGALKRANGLKSSQIRRGQRLRIPSGG